MPKITTWTKSPYSSSVKSTQVLLDLPQCQELTLLRNRHGLDTPNLKGLTKEAQRQIDKRMRRYSGKPEEYQLGRVTKSISLTTFDQLEQEEERDYRKIAGNKL